MSAIAFNIKAKNGQDIYLYLPSGEVQAVDINTVHKITFSEENINFHFDDHDENIQMISYDTLISFKEKNSGIENLEVVGLHLSMELPYMIIESEDVITEISVYNLNGLQLICENVNSPSVAVSLESVDYGIYIIYVLTRSGKHTFKIVK